MEEIVKQIMDFNAYNDHIDLTIIILYVLVGYYLKHNFMDTWKWPMALKVLTVGTVVVGIYVAILLVTGSGDMSAWQKWLFSYTAATSLYEIILKRFEKNNNEAPPDNNPPV